MSPALAIGLGTKLRHLIARLDGDVQQVYDQMGITFRPRFYPFVRVLLQHGPQSVNAIAEHVGVSQPATTQTLGEMKKLGLIRADSGTDRRQQIIRLTPKGKSLSAVLDPVWTATHRAAASLESELSVGLSDTVNQALVALDRKPFSHRIHSELGKAMATTVLAFALLLSTHGATAAKITPEDRSQVVQNTARLIEERYVDAERAKQIARELRLAESKWTNISDPRLLANAITNWLREISSDGHLGLSYSEKVLAEHSAATSFSAAETEKYYGAHLNHGIEKIERLPGNIILLDLRVFPPPAMAGDVFAAAMAVVAQGDALIIDLRKNGGGSETANLLTGYLLEGGKPLSGGYDRPSNTHSANTSPWWVPGRRFGSTKPLYILTSRKTFSAAEAVAYDLQVLKRATIVGEVTGGGAHPFEYRRVHPHFAVDLPEGRSINPITNSNWQDVGVKPDVQVSADQALDTALKLARTAITKDSPPQSDSTPQ